MSYTISLLRPPPGPTKRALN